MCRTPLKIGFFLLLLLVSSCKKTGGSKDSSSPDANADGATESTSETAKDTTPTEDPPSKVGTVNLDTEPTVIATDAELQVGSSVSLVPGKTNAGLATATVGTVGLETSFDLTGSTDFDNAKVDTIISDASMRALSFANKILNIMDSTAYTAMVGKGDYLVSTKKYCLPDEGASLICERLIANVTRETDKPIKLSFWLNLEGGTQIKAKAHIAKGASKGNPFGVYKVVYITANSSNPSLSPRKGAVKARETADGKVIVELFDDDNETENMAVAVMTYDPEAGVVTSGAGRAKTNYDMPMNDDTDHHVVYNADHFLAKNAVDNSERCLDRENYLLNVADYSIFDATTGARAMQQSQRELRRTVAGAEDYGLATYDGISFNNSTSVADGDSVEVSDPSTYPDFVTYTAKVIPGYLQETATETLNLERLKDSRLAWGSDILRYNRTLDHFDVVAESVYLYGQYYSRPVSTTTLTGNGATISAQFEGRDDGVDLAIDTGNGNALTSGKQVTIKRHKPSVDTTYWCFKDCPKGGISQSQAQDYQNGTVASAMYLTTEAANVGAMVRYDYKANTGLLMDVGNGNLPVTADFQLAGGELHLSSGKLIVDSDHQALAGNPIYFQSLASGQRSYTWRTGNTDIDKSVQLVDASQIPLPFTATPQFLHQHSQDADRRGKPGSPFYGVKYLLDLKPGGVLYGIPLVVDSYGVVTRGFGLKDGTTLGSYKVKASSVEESMPEVSRSACDSLAYGSPLDLPAKSLIVDPALGAMPTVSGAAAVVAGVPVE